MNPIKALAAVSIAVLLHAGAAYAGVASAADLDNYALFGRDFRAVVNAAGTVVPDVNMWDVGPGPGWVAYWETFAIKLQGPSDVLRKKKEGGRYLDQYGGAWTVRKVKVMFSDELTSCDKMPSNKFADGRFAGYGECYFLVPEFGGYQTDRERHAAGVRVLKAIDKPTADYLAAQLAARSKAESAEYEREKLAREKATGKKFLLPHEMTRTEMFVRLKAAIYPYVNSTAVSQLKPSEFPSYRIEGQAGAWKVLFGTEDGKRELAAVPGAALEKAGFALSEKYRSILDAQEKDIEYVDTLGIDSYVVKRALLEVIEGKRADERDASVRKFSEKASKLLSNPFR